MNCDSTESKRKEKGERRGEKREKEIPKKKRK